MKIITDWGMKTTSPLEPLNLKNVDAIALHHMSHPSANIYEVERWHLNQGWRAIGYNYWVGFDGRVYEGRGFNIGAGVEDENDHIISIGFQGDYHSKLISMPKAQFNAGLCIIEYVQKKLPHIKTIGGHKDFMPTACPGQYFPLDELKNGIPNELTHIYDIVWDLASRGVLSENEKWLEKLDKDQDAYWLARKVVNYLREL